MKNKSRHAGYAVKHVSFDRQFLSKETFESISGTSWSFTTYFPGKKDNRRTFKTLSGAKRAAEKFNTQLVGRYGKETVVEVVELSK